MIRISVNTPHSPHPKLYEAWFSERDRQKFMKLLLNPPKPNATLRKASKDYLNAIGQK